MTKKTSLIVLVNNNKSALNHFIIRRPTPSTMILNKAVVDVTERERNGLISL